MSEKLGEKGNERDGGWLAVMLATVIENVLRLSNRKTEYAYKPKHTHKHKHTGAKRINTDTRRTHKDTLRQIQEHVLPSAIWGFSREPQASKKEMG